MMLVVGVAGEEGLEIVVGHGVGAEAEGEGEDSDCMYVGRSQLFNFLFRAVHSCSLLVNFESK